MLHGFWLKRYDVDGDYRIEEVAPDGLAGFVRNLADHGYVGANVTMPHKEAALALSEPDDAARTIGAANTLWLEGGRLKSTNTDFEGFLGALDASAPGWDTRGGHALVLGAGGAGRAVVYGLLQRGLGPVMVANRTLAKAEALRDSFGSAVVPVSWNDVETYMKGATLLANTTSLGMHGEPALDVALEGIADDAVVADIVYVPLKTPLLAAAQARGLATSNGLDMLLHQAVTGFEKWFGVRPEVTQEQYDLIAADIPAS